MMRSLFLIPLIGTLFLCLPAWSKSCEVHLGFDIYKSQSLLERESALQRWQTLLEQGPIKYQWYLGQGGEGTAYLNYNSTRSNPLVVHKYFDVAPAGRSAQKHWRNLEGFRELREYKKEGLLGDLEIARMYGASESRIAFYIEYIHGDSILHLTHRRTDTNGGWVAPTYQLRQNMEAKTKDVLARFDVQAEKILRAWEKKGAYGEVAEVTVDGKPHIVVLLIKDSKTNKTIIDLNIMNVVYDIPGDRLVIVDPY